MTFKEEVMKLSGILNESPVRVISKDDITIAFIDKLAKGRVMNANVYNSKDFINIDEITEEELVKYALSSSSHWHILGNLSDWIKLRDQIKKDKDCDIRIEWDEDDWENGALFIKKQSLRYDLIDRLNEEIKQREKI